MDNRELEKILASAEQLRLREFEEVFPGSVVKGRRDYENLLPMTIGINTNKL